MTHFKWIITIFAVIINYCNGNCYNIDSDWSGGFIGRVSFQVDTDIRAWTVKIVIDKSISLHSSDVSMNYSPFSHMNHYK